MHIPPVDNFVKGDRVKVVDDLTPGQRWLGREGVVTRACPSTVVVHIDGTPNPLSFERFELVKIPTAAEPRPASTDAFPASR